jgi:hypothetical protein
MNRTCDACHSPIPDADPHYSFKHQLTGDRIYHGCAACLDQFAWSGWREYKYPPEGGRPIATRRNSNQWIPI